MVSIGRCRWRVCATATQRHRSQSTTASAVATATTFAAGAALKDLGSQDSLKGLIASMATAGALNSLGSHMHIGGKPLAIGIAYRF